MTALRTATTSQSKSDHLVVCEAGEDLSEVIAANYAFALRAGLCIIPEHPKHETRAVLEAFYSLNESRDISPTEKLLELAAMLRALGGDIALPVRGSATFVTDGLPYGFAFPEVPSTHLFKYPDLGLAIINGFASEQGKTRGTNVAVLWIYYRRTRPRLTQPQTCWRSAEYSYAASAEPGLRSTRPQYL